MALRYNVSGVSGNANTLVAGSVIAGNAVFIGANYQKVSNDNSTWVKAANPNNAAYVTIATGTATIVTEAFDAPSAIYGWRYARFVLVTGVATGAVGDLYSIAYSYRQLTGAEGHAP